MKVYKNVIQCPITNANRTLLTVNWSEADATAPAVVPKTVSQLHHIYLLDRSGSMYRDIHELMDNVLQTLDVVHEDDLITIIWFSSHREFKTVVKGAKKSEALKTIINSLRSTIGATCFSDPVREVAEIVKELSPLCPNISVTLFTDGEPVVPWSDRQEEDMTATLVESIQKEILAFNTIGYRFDYNQEFLKRLSTLSEFGEMAHSTKLSEYLTIFTRNFEKVEEMKLEAVEIIADGRPITYLSRNFTKAQVGTMKLSRLHAEKNQFFILGETDADFCIQLNGETISSADLVTPAKPETIANFFYADIYNKYYSGERYLALQIAVKALQEKAIADSHINAFTYDEAAVHLNLLRKAVFTPKSRYADGKCEPDYLPAPDAFCTMDLLTELSSSESLFSPFGKNVPKYRRTTLKSKDTFNVFKKTEAEIRVPFNNFVFAEDFLNLSIRVDIPGVVQINPKQAAKVGLPKEYPSKIYRTYSIITDGKLNMPAIEVLLDATLRQKYAGQKFVKEIEDVTINDTTYLRAVLSLELLPIINRMYVDQSADIETVFKNAWTIESLKAFQKVTKDVLKQLDAAFPELQRTSAYAALTDDQIEVLKDHGVAKDGSYSSVERETASRDDATTDSYRAKSLEFAFKGLSGLPAIAAVLKAVADKKKKGGKLTISQQCIMDAIAEVSALLAKHSFDMNVLKPEMKPVLDKALRSCKERLQHTKGLMSTLKLAKILTGDWFSGLQAIDDETFGYEADGKLLLVKPKFAIRYFTVEAQAEVTE